MLYAKVVFGIHPEGPFDYFIPDALASKANLGSRVKASFRNKILVGYIIGFSKKTNIKKVKPIIELIDSLPLLNDQFLVLAKRISDYYCCSQGEAIDCFLPQQLRKGKKISLVSPSSSSQDRLQKEIILVHNPDYNARWQSYIGYISDTINKGFSVILLVRDIKDISIVKDLIEENLGVSVATLFRKEEGELEEWAKIYSGQFKVVVGVRSAVFAPVTKLGLILIDQEADEVFKQDQVPHYHAREVALMRADIQSAKLVLGGSGLSLEAYYLSKKNNANFIVYKPQKRTTEIKLIDSKRIPYAERMHKAFISKFLLDTIFSVLNSKGKILFFFNRKGFSTVSYCHNCGTTLKCPRCSINLVYHFEGDILSCHRCNFKMAPPKICPSCNSGYIKYSGSGIEKAESELSRIFPQARIRLFDKDTKVIPQDADIVVATSSIIRSQGLQFNVCIVFGLDNALNHIDFRSTEKAFIMLMGLYSLIKDKIIIQTGFPGHYFFRALYSDESSFYEKELEQRKQLKLPPYKHNILIKIRGVNDEKVKNIASRLYEQLVGSNKNKSIHILDPVSGNPVKLRGNFYWNILLSCVKVEKTVSFLKAELKKVRCSSVTVTVNVDPV